MGIIVQKFGGTSVKDSERILEIATKIIERKKSGNDIVVVLSAQVIISFDFFFVLSPIVLLDHQFAALPNFVIVELKLDDPRRRFVLFRSRRVSTPLIQNWPLKMAA